MSRCPTIEALEREFARDRHLQDAPQSTVDAFMFSLRERGVAALAEPETQRRLGKLSSAQLVDCMGRVIRFRANYPDRDELLLILAQQAEQAE